MDYIRAEEFLKQPEEVQKALMKWWKPEIGDLICDIDAWNNQRVLSISNDEKLRCVEIDKKHNYYIPLFTEGQLRKFIEDTTGEFTITGITMCNNRYVELEVEIWSSIRRSETMDKDLLTAYWKYACRLAREGNHEHSN